MNGALFLDRDGTLIEFVSYLKNPAEVKLCPKVKDALILALNKGYKLFLFTNQSAVGRGLATLEEVHSCNARMLELLGLGTIFTAICIATERPNEVSVYRKPSGKFITDCLTEYHLDPKECYMAGDSIKDVKAGIAGGIHPILIKNRLLDPNETLTADLATWVPSYETLWDFALSKL